MDYYRILGLEPSLQLDLEELQKRFYGRSRELHPDRLVGVPDADRDAALLNDAYRALRDPLARAEYFLKEKGFDIGHQGTKDVPPELLEEVFEFNMAVEELKDGDSSVKPQLEAAKANFEAMLDQSNAELKQLFVKHDAAPAEETLKEIRGLLNRRRYIQNLVRDVDGYLSN